MLSLGAYLTGAVELLAVVAAALAGASAARARLLPGWTGAPAWLATAVLALALLIVVAELLGTAGLLSEAPFVALSVAAGAGLRLGLRPAPVEPRLPAPAPGIALTLAGLAFAALVLAHYSVGTRISLGEGMSGFDTTWYHGPFAAGFAQDGSTFELQQIAPQYLSWFYPQNSELVHAFGLLAFGRDILSPLLSLGWMAGCLAAAWCIGRPWGAGPVSLAGAAVALGSGALADQAGEARNDVVATFFVLAAVAFAANGWAARRDGDALPFGVLAVAGLAVGLAAGTKVNFLAPALALAGALALLGASRRRGLAVAGGAALLGGGYWYLRNLLQAGNPLPWVKEVGPVSLPAPDQELGGREAHGILDYLFDPGVWADWFAPGMRDAFGLLWPLPVALALAGIVLCLLRRSDAGRRALAATALAVVAAWLVAPASAEGPEGSPVGFVSGLRYLVPALAVGLALLPLAPGLEHPRRRWALVALFAVAMPFADAAGEPWPAAYVAGAALAGAVAAAAALAVAHPPLRLPAWAPAAAGVVAVALVVAAGHPIQRSYLEDRYARPAFTTPGLDASFAWARDLSGERIATTTTRQYPFWGTDLSNEVRYLGVKQPNGGFVRPGSCAGFLAAVRDTDPRYVVAALDRFEEGGPRFPPEAGWIAGRPGVEVVLRRPPAVVFELGAPLTAGGC